LSWSVQPPTVSLGFPDAVCAASALFWIRKLVYFLKQIGSPRFSVRQRSGWPIQFRTSFLAACELPPESSPRVRCLVLRLPAGLSFSRTARSCESEQVRLIFPLPFSVRRQGFLFVLFGSHSLEPLLPVSQGSRFPAAVLFSFHVVSAFSGLCRWIRFRQESAGRRPGIASSFPDSLWPSMALTS
jgi:hypothetical protein